MSNQIGVRMQPEGIRLLKEVYKARGEDVSDFVRRAIIDGTRPALVSDSRGEEGLGLQGCWV